MEYVGDCIKYLPNLKSLVLISNENNLGANRNNFKYLGKTLKFIPKLEKLMLSLQDTDLA